MLETRKMLEQFTREDARDKKDARDDHLDDPIYNLWIINYDIIISKKIMRKDEKINSQNYLAIKVSKSALY